MIYFKNFIQVTFFLFLSFTLGIIDWIPSRTLEGIVNISIIILYIVPVFFIYKTIQISYYKNEDKKLWKYIGYTVFILSYMSAVSILSIGVAYAKSNYVRSYTFDTKTFYIYQNSDLMYELSIKDSHLPIRSLPFATFSQSDVRLESDEKFIYARVGEDYDKVYNLEKHISIKKGNR